MANYTELPYLSLYKEHLNHLIFIDKKDQKQIYIKTKPDLAPVATITPSDSYFLLENMKQGIMVSTPKTKEIQTCNFSDYSINKHPSNSSAYLELSSGHFHGLKQGDLPYTILNENFEEIKSYSRPSGPYIEFTEHGLIEYEREDKEQVQFGLFNPFLERYDWQLFTKNRISSFKLCGKYCLAMQKMQGGWRLSCIDLEYGLIVWEHEPGYGGYHLIDEPNEEILVHYYDKLSIIDIPSGTIKNSFEVERDRKGSSERIINFNSKEVYFYSGIKENVLGAINRQTGKINWMDHYLPEGCKTLNIYNWAVLGENKHLIHVMDNEHPKLVLVELTS